MNPQDIVVLLKIISLGDEYWLQKPLADALGMSQSEVSKSVSRSVYAGLLDPGGKKVRRLALFDFLQYGLAYAFPVQPGPVLKGVPTSHSAPPLNQIIQSTEHYVWPSGKGIIRGQSITPLYPSVPEAVQKDEKLHELLALADAFRVGRTREKALAIEDLKKRLLDGEQDD